MFIFVKLSKGGFTLETISEPRKSKAWSCMASSLSSTSMMMITVAIPIIIVFIFTSKVLPVTTLAVHSDYFFFNQKYFFLTAYI